MKIFVVDDSQTVLAHTQNILAEEGHEVIMGKSGREVNELIEKEQPDLLLLDYLLPDTNGLKVAQEIKSTYPDLPIILMTGHGSEQTAAEAIRIGIDDYIVKPFLPELLVYTIKRVMKNQERNRALQEKDKLQGVIETAIAVAHQFSQPLTVVMGEAQLMLREIEPDDPSYESFQIIDDSCRELEKILRKLSHITEYKTTEYIQDIRMLDLEEASKPEETDN